MDQTHDDKPNVRAKPAAPSLPFGVFYHPLMSPCLGIPASTQVPEKLELESVSKPMPKQPKLPLVTATCVVTGVERPITDMVRCVLSPDKIIMVDLDEKLPGQFVWATVTKDTFKRAIWRNSFTTAFREKVETPHDLPEKIEMGLLKKSLETLGLAKKAGILTHGFAKVEEWLHAGAAAVYCVANDVSDHARKKLDKPSYNAFTLDQFSGAQLSAALGDVNIMHVGLRPHAITTKFQQLVHKLALIRSTTEPQAFTTTSETNLDTE